METQIDASRDSGGCEDIAVIDEQAVGDDIRWDNGAASRRQIASARRGGAPVEDPGGGESEGCLQIDTRRAPRTWAAWRASTTIGEMVVDGPVSRDDDGVGSLDGIEPGQGVVIVNPEPATVDEDFCEQTVKS